MALVKKKTRKNWKRTQERDSRGKQQGAVHQAAVVVIVDEVVLLGGVVA